MNPKDFAIGFLLAKRAARLPGLDRAEIAAVSANHEQVTFRADRELPESYPFSFFFDNSRGHVVLSGNSRTVGSLIEYEVERWITGSPTKTMKGYVNGWLASSPADFQLRSAEIALENSGLLLPATVTKQSNEWIILVHGRTARRAETFRAYAVFESLGFSCLAISLRNNHEASTAKPPISHFGLLEAGDLSAAIDYARLQGAQRVVVYAISMGAMATSEYLRSGGRVDAVILDSPAVDWPATLRAQSVAAKVTDSAVEAGICLIASSKHSKRLGLQVPVDLRALGFSNWCSAFEIPILILHSSSDSYVPFEPVRELADAHANVSLIEFVGAGHVQLYNRSPQKYREALTTFLA